MTWVWTGDQRLSLEKMSESSSSPTSSAEYPAVGDWTSKRTAVTSSLPACSRAPAPPASPTKKRRSPAKMLPSIANALMRLLLPAPLAPTRTLSARNSTVAELIDVNPSTTTFTNC